MQIRGIFLLFTNLMRNLAIFGKNFRYIMSCLQFFQIGNNHNLVTSDNSNFPNQTTSLFLHQLAMLNGTVCTDHSDKV